VGRGHRKSNTEREELENMKCKQIWITAAAALLMAAALGAPALGAEKKAAVSPALQHLATQLSLVKSSVGKREIAFTAKDFEEALGVSHLDGIVIRQLPSASVGKLMLGSLEVMRNQTVSRSNLSSLRFVPTGGGKKAEFVFEAWDENGYAVTCTLRMSDTVNTAPTAAGVAKDRFTVSTFKNIAVSGILPAEDAEGDRLTYEIVSYPKKGLLSLIDRDGGRFVYTPVKNYAGKDTFTYTVTDEYGNRSAVMTMIVRVTASENGTVFTDMIGHESHYSAIRLSDMGIMEGRGEGNALVFAPEERVSRAEFLCLVMRAAGIEPPKKDAVTVFHDDSEIPAEYKAYVAMAYEKGYITGHADGGLPVFDPNEGVTRGEACVMIGNILDPEAPAEKPVFADRDFIPAWVVEDAEILAALGIIKTEGGYFSPFEGIDRAEAAELLLAVVEMVS